VLRQAHCKLHDVPKNVLQNHQRQGAIWYFYLNLLFQPNLTKNKEMRAKKLKNCFLIFERIICHNPLLV
jgi:hypothetical protein